MTEQINKEASEIKEILGQNEWIAEIQHPIRAEKDSHFLLEKDNYIIVKKTIIITFKKISESWNFEIKIIDDFPEIEAVLTLLEIGSATLSHLVKTHKR